MTKTVKPLDQTLTDDGAPAATSRAEERPQRWASCSRAPTSRWSRRSTGACDEAGFGDVRPAHGTVFQVIDADGTRVTELAARAGMTKQAMTELVVHLEAGGYLERAPDPYDGRARLVRLTRRGWECIRVARAGIAEIEAEWAALIGPDRLGRLKEDLGALNDALAVEPQWPRVGPRA